MKNLIILVFLTLASLSSAQDTDCSIFKNGKFRMQDIQFGEWLIERNGNTQIEYNPKFKFKAEYRVTWINSCAYTLELKKVLENPENVVELKEGLKVNVEILVIKEKSYIQKSTLDFSELEIISEIFAEDIY